MRQAQLEWRDYSFFPYERDFARLEVQRLFRTDLTENRSGVTIPAGSYREESADRLTYFGKAIGPDGRVVIPQQAKLEASAHLGERQGQATRYSAHCLHEYKGRFNPQVVRAIANILELRDGATILDPFCGSGTTLLEAAHAGWDAIGIDRNPLAVRIANAKIDAIRTADGRLEDAAASVIEDLDGARGLSGSAEIPDSSLIRILGRRWDAHLPAFDYMRSWFPTAVLAQIVAIRRVIQGRCSPAVGRIFEIILSDHLRNASYQEPLDLRIRRRKNAAANYPLIDWFASAVQDRIDRVGRARETLGTMKGEQRAFIGDVRSVDLHNATHLPKDGFDAVITSPPYETALPYIDTQRLSLVLFGDVRSVEIQQMEQQLIGARDINSRDRTEFESRIRSGDPSLPLAVMELCRELLAATKGPGNGFRRMNRPALAYRYFRGMSEFFRNTRGILRPGAKLALVVGTNRTFIGGTEFVIDTPALLALVAKHAGYELVEMRAMDTYARYDLHSHNSITSEKLLLLSHSDN